MAAKRKRRINPFMTNAIKKKIVSLLSIKVGNLLKKYTYWKTAFYWFIALSKPIRFVFPALFLSFLIEV